MIKLILEERGELHEMELDRDAITIGRTADNAVRVQDALSSRHHCKIEKTAEGWFVEDLKSRNGTTLNGERLEGRKVLAIGDRVAIGESVVHFGARLEKQAPPPKQKSAKIAKPAATTTRKARYVLKCTEGGKKDKAFGITAFPYTIGSKKGVGLLLDDEDVSPEHCMLVEDAGSVHVVDLNSASGTFVAGKRVKGREKAAPGAIIAIGKAKFRFKDLAAKGAEPASDDEIEPLPPKAQPAAAMPAPVEEVKDLDDLDEEDPVKTPSAARPRPISEKTAPRKKAAPVALEEENETGIAETELSSLALEQGSQGGAGGAIVIVLVVLALLGAALPVAHAFLGHEDRDPEPADNLVANWSFEQDPALRGWKAEGATPVTAGVLHGARAVRLDPKGELRAAEPHRVVPNKALALHAAVKTTGQAACVLAVEWTDETAPDWKELAYAAIVEDATTWTDAGSLLVPPARATHARAVVSAVALGGGSGSVLVDRISFREEGEPSALASLRGAGLDVAATPRGVLHVSRAAANGAPALPLARIHLALPAQDGARGDVLATQLAWATTTAAGDPGDGGLFADGTILDPALGARVAAAVVVKPVGDALKVWWELAKKDYADKRPVRIVIEVPHLRDISPVELQSQSGATKTLEQAFAQAQASFIRLDGIREMAWGTGADQASIRAIPCALEAEKVGDGVRLELVAVPDPKGDVRVVGFEVTKASLGATGRVVELFKQAQDAQKDGRLEEARQIYARLAREFAHDAPVAARARREADALASQADRLLESVTGAAEDAEELGLPELARAAHAWADALAKAFPGAPQLQKATAAVARADERADKARRLVAGAKARDLVARAIHHREANRLRLARTIYEYVIANFPPDDPSVKDAKERLAAMPAESDP